MSTLFYHFSITTILFDILLTNGILPMTLYTGMNSAIPSTRLCCSMYLYFGMISASFFPFDTPQENLAWLPWMDFSFPTISYLLFYLPYDEQIHPYSGYPCPCKVLVFLQHVHLQRIHQHAVYQYLKF